MIKLNCMFFNKSKNFACIHYYMKQITYCHIILIKLLCDLRQKILILSLSPFGKKMVMGLPWQKN